MRRVLTHYKVKNVVHGIAHITGGGLRENLERIVPEGARVELRRDSWTVPPVFQWLQSLGNIDGAEMERVFNMGVGLALVVSPYYADHVQTLLTDSGQQAWVLGEVVAGARAVEWKE